jgi:arylsulfatase A-like enzyme
VVVVWCVRVVIVVDRRDAWDTTAFIVCTDHGHFLGEKDIWGKPGCPIYEPLGHTPLLVRAPGLDTGTCNALSTNVDIHATLCALFGVAASHRTHGRSMVPLLRCCATAVASGRCRASGVARCT